jgi:hypothetical protein
MPVLAHPASPKNYQYLQESPLSAIQPLSVLRGL